MRDFFCVFSVAVIRLVCGVGAMKLGYE